MLETSPKKDACQIQKISSDMSISAHFPGSLSISSVRWTQARFFKKNLQNKFTIKYTQQQ